MDKGLIKFAPLFASLTEDELDTIINNAIPGRLAEGESLFRAGEESDALFLLGQGFIRLATSNGQTLATLGAGSVLGEASLFNAVPHDVSATAVSDVEFLRLSDQKLRAVVLKQPAIGMKLGKNFGSMIAQMQDYLVAQLSATKEFGTLPQHTLQALASQLQPYEIKGGDYLYRNGEPSHGLALVESGALELQPGPGAPDVDPQTVRAGSIVGALALLTDKPSLHDAVATEDTLLWTVSAEDFQAVNSRNPGLRRSLSRNVQARLGREDQAQAASRLAQMPLFASLPADAMQAIAQRMILQHVSAGERVYRVGESGDALYLIESGEIELTAENASGVIEELARIGPEGFFGEMSLFTGQIRVEDATATRNTNLWLLYKSDLDAAAIEHPEIGTALSQGLATRLASEGVSDVQRFRDFELFSNLSDDDLQQVVPYLQPTRFRQGETIFRSSSPSDTLYLIESGDVRVQTFNGGSWLVGEGESIGERSLLTNQPHSASVSAETDVDLWALSKTDFDALLTRYPNIAINISRMLSQRLADSNTYSSAGQAGGVPPTAMQPQQPQMQQVGQQQRYVPAMASSAPAIASRRRQAAAAGVGGEGFDPPPVPRQRTGLVSWFRDLSRSAKLRLAIIILLLIWLLGIAAPAALLSLLQGARVASGAVLSASSSSIAAVYSMGSYEVAMRDQESALAIAMADRAVLPTATYTPFPTPTFTPTNTPLPTSTPLPTNTPRPVAVQPAFIQAVLPAAPAEEEQLIQAAALPARAWDQRLSQLGVRVEDANVAPGQEYWRIIEASWWDEKESGGKHHIYVEVLDENGNRVIDQPIKVYWGDGEYIGKTLDKPFPEYAFNYQMYAAGNAYNVEILGGLPSDKLLGAGMGDIERRAWGIHTSTLITYQKVKAP